MIKRVAQSKRIWLLFATVVLSLLFITNIIPRNTGEDIGFGSGLDYGLDFSGGTQLQLRLERPVEPDVMAIEKTILENRLNTLGLKDIPVRPWGDQYILIQIAQATAHETDYIEEILKKEARFEERIDGEIAVLGGEITVDLTPRGRSLSRTTEGYMWAVSVQHNQEGACRFGKVAEGKKGYPVDIFIDRPQNSSIIFSNQDYMLISNLTARDSKSLFYENTALEVIENRASIPTIAHKNQNHSLTELQRLKLEGVKSVIIAADDQTISDDFRTLLEERGFETERNPQINQSVEKWVKSLTGLESSPTLNFNTKGECIYQAQITGSSPSLDEAEQEIQRTQVLLTSGNLPVKASIESRSTTPPRLGKRFLKYSFYTGIVALLGVAFIVFIRYRQPVIVASMMGIGLSEVIIILGLASIINWELDLPAIAGIIASVGTGIDHLIVITDETLRRGVRKKKELFMIGEQIKRAMFIIFTAAATMIAAMIPIMSVGAGMLKGFAFTTIMGVFVGVLIARPTYAKIIEIILGKEN